MLIMLVPEMGAGTRGQACGVTCWSYLMLPSLAPPLGSEWFQPRDVWSEQRPRETQRQPHLFLSTHLGPPSSPVGSRSLRALRSKLC